MNRKFTRDLRRTMDDIKRFESLEEPERLTRSERRRRARVALLDRRVPDRRCPCCARVKINSRQWVILSNVQSRRLMSIDTEEASKVRAAGAVCRSCAMSSALLCLWN